VKLSTHQYRTLAEVLLKTKPDEITCDEWLDQVAVFAEQIAASRPIPAELQRLVDHVNICPECAEELDALVAALRATE
jgi:hypothetical protein